MEASSLKIKRRQLKAALTRFKKYLDAIDETKLDDVSIAELQCRVDKFEPIYEDFNTVQSELESKLEDVPENEEQERKHFEDDYFSYISKARSVVVNFNKTNHTLLNNIIGSVTPGDNNNSQGNINVGNAGMHTHMQVKFPPIKLPSFSGTFSKWLEFRDVFTALVHNNQTMTDIEKFYYLKSSLQDEASQVIQSMEVTAANYPIAWNLITDRFENKRLIVFNHVKALFEFPSIQKECHSELRKLYDTFTRNLRSLKSLDQPIETWDTLIIFLITSKLDSITRREWEACDVQGDMPSINDMNNFLKTKCELLEKLEYNVKDQKDNKNKKFTNKEHHSSTYMNINKPKCFFCKGLHLIYHCEKLLSFLPQQRITELNKLNLCINCLRPGHATKNCTYSKCKRCNRNHNTLVHIDKTSSNLQKPDDISSSSQASQLQENSTIESHTHTVQSEPQVMTSHFCDNVILSTAVVLVKDNQGKFKKARALLDNGSMSNFVTEDLCKKLGLTTNDVNYCVKGVGQALANINKQTTIFFKALNNNFSSTISCLVIPKITEHLPNIPINSRELALPPNIQLADPTFHKCGKIDILLGASIFWDLLTSGHIQLGKQKPTLQETHLGWIVSGNFMCTKSINSGVNFSISCFNQSDNQINDQLVKFWQIEECQTSKNILSGSDKFCEEHFQNNFSRSPEGHFIVKIPSKENLHQLGNSKEMAINRFLSLERKLDKNEDLKFQYINFMREYNNLGHMTLINVDSNRITDQPTFYLPHHAVVKDTSLTTKVRVVFDASAKSDTNLSLNDVQYSGPTIQSELFTILLRFRQYPFVICADISKMYRQVFIHDDDKPLQRIFWRENVNDPLQCYQLDTVTYGTASAPWLAVRSLCQLAIEYQSSHPKAAKVIQSDFYVDDLLTGSNSIEELLTIQRDVSQILASGGFHLRKWLTNKPELCNQFIVNDDLELGRLQLGHDENSKTLGVLWNSNSDFIQYSIRSFQTTDVVTKRYILSTVSQIYDPLGLLGPVVVRSKLILQDLWRASLLWDTPVSQPIFDKWNKFQSDIQNLNNLNIPRFVLSNDPIFTELHGFSDASEEAYGACIYLRSKNATGQYSSQLLCAKSRVAPVKQISLPRLELCGANLLAHLVKKVLDSITITISKQFLWCDSTITLGWIRGEAKNWKTFVANRVGDIQNLTNPNNWHHIQSADNPADLLSRGISAHDILNSTLWWHGPSWLLDDESLWDISFECQPITNMPERRTILTHTTISDNFNLFNKYSTLSKLQKIVAYCIRFIKNSRSSKEERQFGHLTVSEYENSLDVLIILAQKESFSNEYNNLSKNQPISKRSSLLSLNPFIDHKGLLRVGGRIRNADYDFNKKHPAILPPKHKLTQLIMTSEHIALLHCGPQQLLASIRERLWPISGRNTARKVTRGCVTCFRAKPVAEQYQMGDLPQTRISKFSPFSNVGVDYAGPIMIKDRKLRGSKLIKSYICIFVCMTTKAVHLDLVTDLSTDSFLQVLRRFAARRGRPSNIYSDNGTQFIGANSKLKELFRFLHSASDSIAQSLLKDHIAWHFIPARSPNFGGLWEAGVKSTKHHLKRTVGNLQLNYEDMLTVLIQIEGVLNSRPLSPLSSDPTDTTPLTPAHFIVGKSLTAIPDINVYDIPESRLKKFEKMQRALQHFWKRWQREYISELQSRIKWKTKFNTLLQLNSLVLLKDDDQPPLMWKLGRVTGLHPGADNVIRVATVRLSNGSEVRRATSKLCVLPLESDNSN